jgi:ABC-type uncharacterized transport system permease subunit
VSQKQIHWGYLIGVTSYSFILLCLKSKFIGIDVRIKGQNEQAKAKKQVGA